MNSPQPEKQTVEGSWLELVDEMIRPDALPSQLMEVRRIYYYGAAAVVYLLRELGNDERLNDEELLHNFVQIYDEIAIALSQMNHGDTS